MRARNQRRGCFRQSGGAVGHGRLSFLLFFGAAESILSHSRSKSTDSTSGQTERNVLVIA
eukprot:scaffold78218_cov36-Phaeocystis_antarctica.AAC.2